MLFRLVAKDFRANGLYLAISLGILFVLNAILSFGVLGSESGPVSAGGDAKLTVAIPMFFLVSVLGSKVASLLFLKIDDMSDSNTFFASLPVKRKELVKARYISSAILACVALVVLLLATLPAYFIYGASYSETFSLLHYPAFWCIFLLFIWFSNSISFPFYFRFGLARGVFTVVIIQVLLATAMVIILLDPDVREGILDFAEGALDWINTIHIALLGLGSLGITLLLMLGSAMLSVKFYKVRDL
ncbi:MAG: ABC-2 transporter permease [Roseivirga sp.]|nr:ABC-2 transporter permease [Roseivirga sp.]